MIRTTTMIIATAAAGIVATQTSMGAVQLTPVLGPTGSSSLGVFFDTDGVTTPEEFGQTSGASGPNTVAGGTMLVGTIANNFVDYRPTTDLDQGTPVALDSSIPWVFRLDFEQSVHTAGARMIEVGDNLGDTIRVVATSTANEYTLEGDDPGGTGYGVIATFSTGGGQASLHLQYDPADNLFDFFVNNVEVAADFLPRDDDPGLHGFNFVRIAGHFDPNGFIYDNIIATNGVIPEPGILALLGVSALVLRGLRRRSGESISEDSE